MVPLCGAPVGFEMSNPQLTTLLDQVDATAAVTLANVNFNTVEMILRDVTNDGANNSYVALVSNGHVFSAGLVV